jgi:cytochrome P450
MTGAARWPVHVPEDLVRDFDIHAGGELDDILARFAAIGRDPERVVWLPVPFDDDSGDPGAWLLTKGEDIRAALQQPDLFSSDSLRVATGLVLAPATLDPPLHTAYRRVLDPLMSPRVVREMEQSIRARAVALVESVAGAGGCEFVGDVAVHFPTRVFTSWFGLAEEQTGYFVSLVGAILHDAGPESRQAAGAAIGILSELIAARLAAPADDLVSSLIAIEPDGRRLAAHELLGMSFLLFIAGLDTVVAAMSFSVAHLARHPAQRAAVVSGAVPVATAVEELLRRYSFVNPPRRLTKDTTFAGVAMRAGDLLITSTHLASTSDADYPDALDVDFGRGPVRHYGFGAGAHRCLGSHLARLELRVFLQEWHARIPTYELVTTPLGHAGSVMGLRELRLRWDG